MYAVIIWLCIGSLVVRKAKYLPANAGDRRDVGSIPGLGRSPGGGNSNLLQYSCLDNFMDRGAWWATVHGVEKELDTTEGLSTKCTLWLSDMYVCSGLYFLLLWSECMLDASPKARLGCPLWHGATTPLWDREHISQDLLPWGVLF